MRVNDEVGTLLEEYADLLAITGGDAFKVRVYEKAARSVAGHPADLAGLDAAGLAASDRPAALMAAFTGLPPADQVIAAGDTRTSIRTGTALEVDSLPDRLDLSAEHVRQARRHGVRFAIDSDAHAVPHLVRGRYRAARPAHGGRGHQHLAGGPADRLPAGEPLTPRPAGSRPPGGARPGHVRPAERPAGCPVREHRWCARVPEGERSAAGDPADHRR